MTSQNSRMIAPARAQRSTRTAGISILTTGSASASAAPSPLLARSCPCRIRLTSSDCPLLSMASQGNLIRPPTRCTYKRRGQPGRGLRLPWHATCPGALFWPSDSL